MKEVNQELQEKMVAYLEENSAMMLSGLAKEFEINDFEVAKNLPYEMCAIAKPEDFDKIWEGICQWEKCTFLMIHLGTVLEIQGKLGEGKYGHGYYNLSHSNGSSIAGHIKVDDIKGIAFVSLPSKKFESMHIAFFNQDEEMKFAVFMGRDENKNLFAQAKENFYSMKKELC